MGKQYMSNYKHIYIYIYIYIYIFHKLFQFINNSGLGNCLSFDFNDYQKGESPKSKADLLLIVLMANIELSIGQKVHKKCFTLLSQTHFYIHFKANCSFKKKEKRWLLYTTKVWCVFTLFRGIICQDIH